MSSGSSGQFGYYPKLLTLLLENISLELERPLPELAIPLFELLWGAPLSILLTASLICDNGPPMLPPDSSRGYCPLTIPRKNEHFIYKTFFVWYSIKNGIINWYRNRNVKNLESVYSYCSCQEEHTKQEIGLYWEYPSLKEKVV